MKPAEPYLPHRTVALEQSRGRVLLISIATLMLLSISPVLGHHVA